MESTTHVESALLQVDPSVFYFDQAQDLARKFNSWLRDVSVAHCISTEVLVLEQLLTMSVKEVIHSDECESSILSASAASHAETYGEVTPPFVSQMAQKFGLSASSLFIDIGSGIGNVVAHMSMLTGCTSFGIEIRKDRLSTAARLLATLDSKLVEWGLSAIAHQVQLQGGDITKIEVGHYIRKADLIFVNNRVFDHDSKSIPLMYSKRELT